VVTLSSSDTKKALELLSLNPSCGSHSRLSKPSSSSGSDLFKDWSKANDMATSVYVALTIDASSSCTPAVNAPHGERESLADGSPNRQSRSRVAPS
jgi:hypothetical protein